MSKNKKETGLVLAGQDVPSQIAAVEAALKNLKTVETSKFKTNGNLSAYGSSINIQTETNIESLLKATASLIMQKQAYDMAQTHLELKSVPAFKIGGYSVEEWTSDIKLRIEIINHKEKADKLTAYKNKLSEFISKEEQKAMLLKEMEESGLFS